MSSADLDTPRVERNRLVASSRAALVAIWLFLGYASSAYADAVGFVDGISAIPIKAWGIAAAAALAGGVTKIMMTISNSSPPAVPTLLSASVSLFLSMAAGGIGFLTGLMLHVPPEAMMLSVAGCGLVGTKVIEALGKRVTKQADKLA